MSPHVQSTHALGERELPEITLHTLTDDGVFPNNARLPLTVYRQAVAVPKRDLAARFEALFAANHWPPAWRSSIFGYHHYHSTAHEVLGVFRGRATLQCGGEHGVVVEVQVGDVVVIPAGVAHKSLQASENFCAVGAYPRGQRWDTCTGAPGERPRTDRNIASVPLPPADPLYGPHGPLMTHWSAGEYSHDYEPVAVVARHLAGLGWPMDAPRRLIAINESQRASATMDGLIKKENS